MRELWVVAHEWDACNMGGIDYWLCEGAKEIVALALPGWCRQPEGSRPRYDPWGTTLCQAEIHELSSSDALDNLITPKPTVGYQNVPLAGESADEYCFIAPSQNLPHESKEYITWSMCFGTTGTLEEMQTYKELSRSKWAVLRIVNKYRWEPAEKLPY